MLTIKRIRVLSLAKITGCIYGGLGLIFAGIFGIISLTGLLAGIVATSVQGDGALPEAMFGGAASLLFVVAVPIFYGTMGFILGLILAFLYNLIAHFVGGVQFDIELQ